MLPARRPSGAGDEIIVRVVEHEAFEYPPANALDCAPCCYTESITTACRAPT